MILTFKNTFGSKEKCERERVITIRDILQKNTHLVDL